jgi:hypothetical protein
MLISLGGQGKNPSIDVRSKLFEPVKERGGGKYSRRVGERVK